MSFKSGPEIAKCGAEALPEIFARNRNVFCAFVRRKNGNVVLLEGIVKDDGTLEGIDSFWLDLEPAYRAAARARGRQHDRDELNVLDRRAYGFSSVRVNAKTLTIRMNQLPDYPITVRAEANGVHAYAIRDAEIVRLRHIYVHDRSDGWLPSVDHIDVHVVTRNRVELVVRVTK